MDLLSMPICITRLAYDDKWFFLEGTNTLFASPVAAARLRYPNNPHDQIDELNRYQQTEIDRRFNRLIQNIKKNY